MNSKSATPVIQGKRILYGVLDWGLGHASKSLSFIKMLAEDNEVYLIAGGSAALFLKSELPNLPLFNIPNFHVRYAKHRIFLVPRLILQLPGMLFSLWWEHRKVESLVDSLNINLIFSDNRYGIYSRKAPSFFLTHQLRFKLPGFLKPFEIISEWFNRWYFRKYTGVLVLDKAGSDNLAGDLAHAGKISGHPKVHFIGFWSSLEKAAVEEDIDVLAVISGPEPHRRIFAQKVIEQLKQVPGKRIVVLGKPQEAGKDYIDNGVEVYQFRNRQQLSELICRARLVVCRPGYASIMDMIKLGKRALMVPTPGQSEQEYQAEYCMQKGYFFTVTEKEMNLAGDIKHINNSQFKTFNTEMNCRNIFQAAVLKNISNG